MPRTLVRMALVMLLAVTALGTIGCADASEQPTSAKRGETPATPPDSSREAYAAAEEAVRDRAPDAVLVSAGTQGVALAEIPDSWSFYFVSPSDKKVWQVVVEHGKAQPVQELGDAKAEVDYDGAVSFDSIKVAGAEAVEKARAFGEKTGDVAPNVVVMGPFIDVAAAEGIGATLGSWAVTFTEGTDLEGSRVFTVNMETGEVNELEQ